MKKLSSLILLMAALTAIISCQKEIIGNNPSTDTTGGGIVIPPSTNGDLLVKIYGKIGSGADSNVTYYSYNAAKQLVSKRTIINTNGGFNNWDGYERNAAGLIIRRKQHFVSGATPIQADTSVTNYYYSGGATPKITYSVTSIGLSGFSINDSSVYTYNAVGKLSKTETYQSDLLSGTYAPSTRTVFTFDATGNVTKLDLYDLSSGSASLVSTQIITYDSKLPPQNFTEAESIVINSEPAFIHNTTKSQINNFVAGAGNITNDFTLTYNSASKPATIKEVTQFNGTTTATNFTLYYQ